MKKTFTSIFALSLLTVTTAFAQVSFGPKIGLNLNTVSEKTQGESTDYKTNVGFHVGGMLNAQINDYFAIRPELLYTTAGYKVKDGDFKLTANYGYIALPVNFVGQLPVSENFKLQVFAGPYAALCVGGKYKFESPNGTGGTDKETSNIKPGKEDYSSDDSHINPLDLGFNFGLGFQASSFVFTASYKLGMTNINAYDKDGDNDYRKNNKLHNRGFNFGVAYLFGGK